ncbi:2Fe-2S iron-sulfur cluster binding domain-containing protein [Massilia sp. CCM 8733]|uniref:2Fe-2S iron-sulfur cluster binding domain-containing protein n=1 Tax=Massilia mucilaginosa TaxID=2609282 RepID=A0ABX0P236_9BURK|nr:2Fe-2S iron-sulfur cluster-binding protein [Massilia mucilaginosa]NHZ92846.1 2Fe-2S iron-sulfur cluster binding domain-containing protein [Massilia mucilaginosa]
MDSYLITVRPGGWRFEAEAGQTLLAAAEAAGVNLPSSCRNGTCRTCLCRLVQGEVGYLIAWPGLSLDEKRAGDTLPCVALARSDVVLLAPSARRVDAI